MNKLFGISGVIIIAIILNSCKKEIDTTVKDIDGNSYNIVTIGTQVWMKENLRTTRYQNGDLIRTTTQSAMDITNDPDPKFQWAYDGNERTTSEYGRLYTWSAATDIRNVCPAGWHVPDNKEWTILTDYLTKNGYGFDGGGNDIAKSVAAQEDWISIPTKGSVGNDQASNNASGFSGLPGGHRYETGTFQGFGLVGYWWSSTGTSPLNASSSYLRFGSRIVKRETQRGFFGLSVRCLQD